MKQKNYIRISSEKYLKNDLTLFKHDLKDPDNEDIEISKEIIEFQKKIGDIDMGGAWKFYNENTRTNYVKALKEENTKVLAYQLCNMFQTECTSAIITPSINVSKNHDLLSQMAWDLDACSEFTRNKYDLKILDAGNIGTPFGTIRDSIEILPDSPRHLYFADLISSHINNNDKILEVGGGYGGLIYFLRKIDFKGTYYNIDLPETLFVCYYYLRKSGHKVNLIYKKQDIKLNEVNLIPSMYFEKITKNLEYSVFFNSASLSEMDEKVCFNYIEMVNKTNPNYIIHCNSNYLAFPDSKIHIEILAKNFPWSENFNLKSFYLSPFQGASGRYRIHIYENTL